MFADDTVIYDYSGCYNTTDGVGHVYVTAHLYARVCTHAEIKIYFQ